MQYPKMLYKGDQENYSHEIAETENQEQLLREDGYTDFMDLPEPSPNVKYAEGIGIKLGSVLQNEELTLKINELEQENAHLKEVIAKGSAENIELHKKLRIKELKDTSADELKVLLTGRGIQFGARDCKDALVDLVIKSDSK